MTRDEMESLLTDFCKSKIGCESCPMEDYENCDLDELTDAELERVVERIRSVMESEEQFHKQVFGLDGTVYTQDPDRKGWTGQAERIDVQPQQTDSGTVMVNRDLLNTIKGELLMLAACDGAPITHGMSNEMMCIVENIDMLLKGVEG